MLWEKGPYLCAIAASLSVVFVGLVAITDSLGQPKAAEPACQISSAVYDQVRQCPPGTIVVHLGQRLGRWDGVSIMSD